MGFFDDFVVKTGITDEADRKIALDLATKYPTFRTLVDETDTKLREWETWKTNAWDATAGKSKDQVRVETELDQARARIAQIEAGGGYGGVDMTFDEVEAQLKAKGYVPKDQIADLAKPVATSEVNRMAGNIEQFYKRTLTLPVEHYQEFGTHMDADKLLELYAKGPGGDPRLTYDQMVAPLREEKRKAADAKREEDHQAALKAAREEGERAGRQAVAMGAGQPGMPSDQTGATPSNLGHMQRSQAERLKAGSEASGGDRPLGSGVSANEGLAWLQEFRNSGGQVQ